MFPELKKKKYQLEKSETEEVLRKGMYGILSLLGENDYCYGVPIHHAYKNGIIYVHCAPKGCKIDAAKHHPRVCYTVVDQKIVVLEGKHDTRYTSVCAFGQISRVSEKEEKAQALKWITEKYDPKSLNWLEEYVKGSMPVDVWKIKVEHLEGKSSFLAGDVERN